MEGRLKTIIAAANPTLPPRLFALLILFWVSLVGSNALQGQSFPSRRITTDEGLPEPRITSGIEDRHHCIWFASSNGLIRYDGVNFQRVEGGRGFPRLGLSCILEDSKGRIWVADGRGTVGYIEDDEAHDTISDLWLRKLLMPLRLPLTSIAEDKQGGIWFTNSVYFACLRDTVVFQGEIPAPLQADQVRGFTQFLMGDDGSVRLVCERQILKWDGHHFQHEEFQYVPNNPNFNAHGAKTLFFTCSEGIVKMSGAKQVLIAKVSNLSAIVEDIFQDRNGHLLISTTQGIYLHGTQVEAPFTMTAPIQLADYVSDLLLEDHEGNLWYKAKDNGVVQFMNGFGGSFWLNQGSGLQSDFVTAMAKDNQGNYWFGNDRGEVDIFTKDNAIQHLKFNKAANVDNRVLRILPMPDGSVWVGLKQNLFKLSPEGDNPAYDSPAISVPLMNAIDNLEPAPNDDVAFTVFSMIIRVNGATRSLIQQKMGTEEATKKNCQAWGSDGTLYMGTDNGLLRFDGQRMLEMPAVNAALHTKVSDIEILGHDTLALATLDSGIVICTPNGILGTFSTSNGMPSNRFDQLYRFGNSLFGTNLLGITEIDLTDPNHHVVHRFTKENGLPTNDIKGVWVDSTYIVARSSKGVCFIARNQPTIAAPVPTIQQFRADGVPTSEIEFPWNTPDFLVKFQAITYRDPKAVTYQYRLIRNGEPRNWTETKGNAIPFSGLGAGSYVFEVQAKLNANWSASAQRFFVVSTPFWLRGWFIALVVVVALAIGYGIYRWRVAVLKRKFQAELQLRAKITALENQAFQAMMNPHFIFNVMNSIRHYLLSHDVDSADHYLARFAKLVRSNLNLVARTLISLEEEVAYLEDYISLESLRFPEGLTWEIDVAPELEEEDVQLPSMLLQPFVENAILHGLLPLERKGHLQIDFSSEADGLMAVTITDDGIGYQPKKVASGHESKGVSLTKERMRLLGLLAEKEIGVTISAIPQDADGQGGTVVKVLLPLDFPAITTV